MGLVVSGLAILAVLFCLGFRPAHIALMFSHPITGGTQVETDEKPGPQYVDVKAGRKEFGAVNFAVLGCYLVGILAVGFAASRRIKTTRGFFVAEGKLNYVIVGLSLLGTYLSALTMIGLPGAAYGKHNWTYMVQLPFLVITAAIITGVVLPRYREAGAISIYAFLEQRIGVSARMIGSISFIIFAIGRMGLVLYLPALAFNTVTGVSLPVCIVVMGIIITLYTVMGGIEAVVWTDAIQVVIFIVAAILSLGYIFSDLGVERFLAISMAHNKFRLFTPSLDLTRITTLWLILETIFQTIRIYGTQQDMAQRYMTTESTEKANRSVWIAILTYIPLGFIFYFMGTALFAFYKVHPDAGLPVRPDQIYPYFVVDRLPAGVAGLVIAAIFAAAMSSIDSCMNSASAVWIQDFSRRFSRTQHTDAEDLRKARVLTVFWGVLAVVMALVFMNTEYALIVWGKLMGICTNGILGLMALAFLPFRVRGWAAVIGFIVSYACLFAMMASNINFLLWPVIGNSVCFLTALFMDRLAAKFLSGPGRQ